MNLIKTMIQDAISKTDELLIIKKDFIIKNEKLTSASEKMADFLNKNDIYGLYDLKKTNQNKHSDKDTINALMYKKLFELTNIKNFLTTSQYEELKKTYINTEDRKARLVTPEKGFKYYETINGPEFNLKEVKKIFNEKTLYNYLNGFVNYITTEILRYNKEITCKFKIVTRDTETDYSNLKVIRSAYCETYNRFTKELEILLNILLDKKLFDREEQYLMINECYKNNQTRYSCKTNSYYYPDNTSFEIQKSKNMKFKIQKNGKTCYMLDKKTVALLKSLQNDKNLIKELV